MGVARKSDLDHRLEAYFATLRSSSLRDVLKRSAGNWQIYAAVTGAPSARSTAVKQTLLSSKSAPPMLQAVRVAMAQTQAPSISPGGVVPLDGTANMIQPGEWVSIFGANL